jgi:hypothetical protein
VHSLQIFHRPDSLTGMRMAAPRRAAMLEHFDRAASRCYPMQTIKNQRWSRNARR